MRRVITIEIVIALSSLSISILVTVLSNNELQASLMVLSLAIVMILLRDVFLQIEKIIYMLQSISNISITY